MIDRRVLPLGEWVELCYGSRVALWLDMFTLECYLDTELEQTGTVCVKERDVGRVISM